MRILIGNTILLFLLLLPRLQAQEILVGLEVNPVAKDFYQQQHSLRKSGTADTLELPFIDDFSGSYVKPDNKKWTDQHAFINPYYAVSPVSLNVATLDALDYDGSHYPHASISPFVADHLTSHPVNLAYLPSDSVYLSFFYQPQGLGEMPDPQDSLCLDFYAPEDETWVKIWGVPGTPLKDFERVMISIKDLKYLKKGFRFRFRNFASLPVPIDQADRRSNVDHWHIDYVLLDKLRSAADTVLRDVAFTAPIKTIMKDFEAVPWAHFQNAYITQRKPFIDVRYENHDTITRNVTRELQIVDQYSGYNYRPVPTASDILSGQQINYSFPFDYPFNFGSGDSAEFLIRTILRTDAFDYKPNDTITYFQKFFDYYALDDGTAEAGYGLRGEGTMNASVAVKFNTFRPDTIRAVDMYFNQLPDSLNLNFYFYLNVWDNNNGKPGTLRYSQLGMRPEYSNELNRYHRYQLDSAISVSDTFFVGWTQTVEKLINIGFDRNRINNHRILYTSGGFWNTSSFSGSLMLRPVVRMTPLVYSSPPIPVKETFLVYPNPAHDILIVEQKEYSKGHEMLYVLTDMSGRQVFCGSISERTILDISGLMKGIYLLIIKDKSGKTMSSNKVVKF